jgi:hypothetical protein
MHCPTLIEQRMPPILPNGRMIKDAQPLCPPVTFSNFRQYTFISSDFRQYTEVEMCAFLIANTEYSSGLHFQKWGRGVK